MGMGDLIEAERALGIDPPKRKPAANSPSACPACKGRGVIGERMLAQEPCADCGGSGLVNNSPSAPEHNYTSTACQHGLHDRCRKNCKFCGVGCRCECHKKG